MCNLRAVNFSRTYILFLVKFLALFSLLYFGTYAFIGLSVEGGRYIPFLKQVDYVSAYRQLLLKGGEKILNLSGYYAYVRDEYHLYINGRSSIQLVYECLGIGVISFWISFIAADLYGNFKKKITWILIGVIMITLLNMIRIALLLLAAYKKWINVGLFDHHTLYNAIVYACVLGLLLYYRKVISKPAISEQ